MQENKQSKNWSSEFGDEYTDRNPLTRDQMNKLYEDNYGITRIEMNGDFLDGMDRCIRILEVGCNVGVQLDILKTMGFENLYGIEISRYAIETSKKLNDGIDIIEGNALDIPFKDNWFDLVFTSGVLIHISPDNIVQALQEISRCSSRYIWGFEYYADVYTNINYHGDGELLWKANFPRLYLQNVCGLELKKAMTYKYLDNNNEDIMYLLKKV